MYCSRYSSESILLNGESQTTVNQVVSDTSDNSFFKRLFLTIVIIKMTIVRDGSQFGRYERKSCDHPVHQEGI